MNHRLSKDFKFSERGNIIQQIKRGKSYSEVARFWSAKKQKAISFSTIKAICNRRGIKSTHPKGWKTKDATMNLHNINNITEPKSFFQRIINFFRT